MTEKEKDFIISAVMTSLIAEGANSHNISDKLRKEFEARGITPDFIEDMTDKMTQVMLLDQFGDVAVSEITVQELKEGTEKAHENLEELVVMLTVDSVEMLIKSMEALA